MSVSNNNSVMLLLKWAGKEKYKLYAAMLCGLISGLAAVIPYIAIFTIIERTYRQTLKFETIAAMALLIFAGLVIRQLFLMLGLIFSHKSAFNTLYKVRCLVINHLAVIPLGWLNNSQTGEIKKVLTEDTEKLELFLAHHLPELVMYGAGPVVIFIYLCTINILMALISLIPIPLVIMLQFWMFRGYGKRYARFNQIMGELNAAMVEYINGMRLIKAYSMGSQSFKKFALAISGQCKIWTEISIKMGPPYALFLVVLECAALFLIPAGGYLLLNGRILAGTFILFAFVGSLYLLELRPLLELGENFAQVLNGLRNVKEILDIKAFPPGGEPFPAKHAITFENVSFAYNTNQKVLRDVNLQIDQNEKIALVGRSGSGKSTVIQLVSRFYDVTDGAIKIGGVNVKDINYTDLLANIAVVFQNTFLSKESVLDNIRAGGKASLDEVMAAARQAQIHDFIVSLPQGYHTKVGGYGTRFSGGEKQRIAIARAIVKNAPILILDEATAAADPENQQKLNVAINNLCEGKTVIMVAHRLDSIKNCDRVAVVENGTVTDIDVHDKLLQKNTYYHQAWHIYEKARRIVYASEKAGV